MRVTRRLYEVDGWGLGEVWERDGLILHHELAAPAPETAAAADHPPSATGPQLPRGDARPPDGTLPGEVQQDSSGFVPDLCRRFALHLAGQPVKYGDVPIDLTWATPFQQALVAAARAVPWGEAVSYGELAALAGRPGAARAAGTFCAENRFSLIVPCHRVVAANGIGGYGPSGVSLKRRLLSLEGVLL